MSPKHRSSSWSDAVRHHGEKYVVAGPVCPGCGHDAPGWYFVGQYCLDCQFRVSDDWAPARSELQRDVASQTQPWTQAQRQRLPDLSPEQLAALPPAQQRVYEGLQSGLGVRELARLLKISPAAVCQARKRLQQRISRKAPVNTGVYDDRSSKQDTDAAQPAEGNGNVYSSGTSTTSCAAGVTATLIAVPEGGSYNTLEIVNEGTTDGFFSVDGVSWGYVPGTPEGLAPTPVKWYGRSSSNVQIMGGSNGLSGVYGFCDMARIKVPRNF